MRRRIPKLIISAVFFAMCWVRDGAFRLAGRRIPGRCTVLYYHSVPAEHKARFEAQMDDLLHFTVPAAADQVAPLEPGKRYAIVTFDDAYQNILVNALPALEARGIRIRRFPDRQNHFMGFGSLSAL